MGGLVQHGCLLISIVLASSSVSTAENTFPPDSSSFLSVSAGSVTLHLDALVEEGSPTTYFVVEYKPKATENWILAWDNVHPGGDFVVLDLSPATWYDLKVTSHNDDGGFDVAEYEFGTLTTRGGPAPPQVYPVNILESSTAAA